MQPLFYKVPEHPYKTACRKFKTPSSYPLCPVNQKTRNSDIIAKIILYLCDRFVIEYINKIKTITRYRVQDFTRIRIFQCAIELFFRY